jgi:hypothetical protein
MQAGSSLSTTEWDVERAVDSLRRQLALRGVRRQLLSPVLDARTALQLSRLALQLQLEPPTPRAELRRLSLFSASRRSA